MTEGMNRTPPIESVGGTDEARQQLVCRMMVAAGNPSPIDLVQACIALAVGAIGLVAARGEPGTAVELADAAAADLQANVRRLLKGRAQ